MRTPARWITTLSIGALVALSHAASAETADEILRRSPANAWSQIDPGQMLIMTLADKQRIIIQLAPDFAPRHIDNIHKLALAHWWDGGAIERSQDNYVVQWRGPVMHPPLPEGVSASPPAEYERAFGIQPFLPLPYPDAYASKTGYIRSWPVGTDGEKVWLTHCYGMIGVARDMPPDTGDGTELYAVNGQAPRQLDRNIALVGRVIAGMDALSALPRGKAPLGFYKSDTHMPVIESVRLASELPPAEQPRFQVMRTASDSFKNYIRARANRSETFFVRPAAGLDVCNAPIPIREEPARHL